MSLDKVLYIADVTATGGREGRVLSSDGALDMALTTPKALGGNGVFGANPEQLFAGGYAACFIGALKVVCQREAVALPETTEIAAQVGIGPEGQGFNVNAQLNIKLPGINRELAQQLVDKAHQVCPYSNATRGNIEVTLVVVD